MKKQTHLHLEWPESEYILSKFSFLGELLLSDGYPLWNYPFVILVSFVKLFFCRSDCISHLAHSFTNTDATKWESQNCILYLHNIEASDISFHMDFE